MGVRRSDWIVIGVNIGMEYADWDEHEELLDKYYESKENGKISYVIDGMSGEYFIVGIPLFVDKDGYDGIQLHEFDFNEQTNEQFLTYSHRVREHVKENFGIDVMPKIIVLTHWS